MKIGNARNTIIGGDGVIIWQYANARHLNRIIQDELAFFKANVSDFISNWQRDVFNLKTANDFGLKVWGDILGSSRLFLPAQNETIDTDGVLRFYNPNADTWHSVWLEGTPTHTLRVEKNPPDITPPPVQIDSETYRRCLLAKILLLRNNGSISDINHYLYVLYNGKPVYVQDNYDMTMDIVFGFIPSTSEITVITTPEYSPKPAGVGINYGVKVLNKRVFGFSQNELGTWADDREMPPAPYGYGTFYTL